MLDGLGDGVVNISLFVLVKSAREQRRRNDIVVPPAWSGQPRHDGSTGAGDGVVDAVELGRGAAVVGTAALADGGTV